MTDKDLKRQIEAVRRVGKAAEKSPELARRLLVRAGILTTRGNVRKPYK